MSNHLELKNPYFVKRNKFLAQTVLCLCAFVSLDAGCDTRNVSDNLDVSDNRATEQLDQAPDDKRFLGQWEVVSLIIDGRDWPYPKLYRDVLISNEQIVFYTAAVDLFYRYTISVDTSAIDLDIATYNDDYDRDIPSQGIYCFHGDLLAIRLGKPRPTHFGFESNEEGVLYVFRRKTSKEESTTSSEAGP